MEAKSSMMLKVLINRFSPKSGNALLRFLPKEDAESVMNQEVRSTDILPLLNQPQHVIEKIHYSWLKGTIEKLEPKTQSLILGALTPAQAGNLKKFLNQEPFEISDTVKPFLIKYLYSLLAIREHIPIDYLPDTELASLLSWTKKELTILIDFLGLYDLACEVRKIVNKKHLENIYSCLPQNHLSFLKVCLYQKEKLIPPKLGINHAERNCEQLRTILHQRGLMRLGKGICGQHPDFIWYLVHTLDIGRGKAVLHYYKPQSITNVTAPLKTQIINVMNYLKKSKP